MKIENCRKGFTLIELLVVISIIGLLSSIVLASLNSARAKARDAKRKSDLHELTQAAEVRFNDVLTYPATAGWFSNAGHGGLDAALVTPGYISKVSDDPGQSIYMYWRKDFVGYSCLAGGQPERFGFYAVLENPSASDQATISDSFDICVKNTWGMNYKMGN